MPEPLKHASLSGTRIFSPPTTTQFITTTMNKFFVSLGGVSLVAVVGAFLWFFTWGSEATIRSDQPLSRETATLSQSNADLLPASTQNIYYLYHAEGMQGGDSYLRFEVAPDDREATVEAIIHADNVGYKRQLRYAPLDIHDAPHVVPEKKFLPMPWWNTPMIVNGYYRGEDTFFSLQVWVDTENSIIYVYHGD